MTTSVDKYLVDGCMRCKFGATPQCKVNTWRDPLVALRHIALNSGLDEEAKWGVPCYTLNGKNVCTVSAFKDYACISFFKGALMKDPQKLFSKHGESSQAARIIKFTDTASIISQQDAIAAYIQEAIGIEKAGKKITFKSDLEAPPEELLKKFEDLPAFRKAFYALTKGRQRGYIIHFSQPKKSETRAARIEKFIPQIMQGIGLHDQYKSR